MTSGTFRQRMLFSLGGVAVVGLLAAGFSTWNSSRLSSALETAVTSTAIKLDLVNALRARTQEMAACERVAWIRYSHGENASADKAVAQFRKAAKRVHEQVVEIRELLTTDRGRALLDEINREVLLMEPSAEKTFRASIEGRHEEARAEMEKTLDPGLKSIEKSATELVASLRAFLKEDREAAQSSRTFSWWVSILSVCLLAASGAWAWFTMAHSLKQLGRIVENLEDGAKNLTTASSQLSKSSQDLSESACRQASAIEQTSASSEEIRAMAERNGEQAGHASEDMGLAVRWVHEAETMMKRLSEWGERMKSSSQEISKVIRVIDEIAFQTNILALNAAVEAARAGEAGMGFAVVADEVRSLAQRCAQAARETTQLIQQTLDETHQGQGHVVEMSTRMEKLGPVAETTKTRVEAVRTASDEQVNGISQIGKAMTELEKLTQGVASGAEESAAASEELHSQAATLEDVVASLAELAR